ANDPPRSTEAVPGEPSSAPADARFGRRQPWHRRLVRDVGLVSAIFTLMAGTVVQGRAKPHESTSPSLSGPVLTVAFENLTGDSTLDIIGPLAADWITQGLA